MKKIIYITTIALSFVCVTSCDQGFDELNKSKVNATSVDPAFTLNNAALNASAPGGSLQYDIGIVQHIISSNSGVITGANFNVVHNDNAAANWNNYYRNVVKYTSDVITKTKDVPARSNLYNMARILQSYAFLILTDTYGDIPYSEGGQGYNKANFFPKYDTQQAIYNGIIQELTDASAALSASGTIEVADIIYSGDIPRWKKFGYSLLLRAGMRLSKIDPTKAQATVAAAAAGGVILVNADNAVVRHNTNYVNPVGNTLNSTEAANYYLTKPFVDALKANADPRLPAIAIRYTTATSGVNQTTATPDMTAANQFGMPIGCDDNAAQTAALNAGLVSRYAFSQVDRARMASQFAPMYMVTAAQSNLLLAEAVSKTWVSGTVAAYFDAGIKAAIDNLANYGTGSTVSGAARDTYAASRVAALTLSPLQEINYEYWVASFLNGQEAWANVRRSGFPALIPNPYPQRSVDRIYRLVYPNAENLVNNANYLSAAASIGGDKLDTRIWWDKP